MAVRARDLGEAVARRKVLACPCGPARNYCTCARFGASLRHLPMPPLRWLRLVLAVSLTFVSVEEARAQDRLRVAADSFFVLSRPNDEQVFPDFSDSTRLKSERRLER